jgi:hypothetical protein
MKLLAPIMAFLLAARPVLGVTMGLPGNEPGKRMAEC